MASPTYTVRGIVLRKTKLGEADLVVTLLATDGSQVRVAAKGARKPRSSFAARLELYSVVDMMCARGKSLDIAKEARLVASNERLRRDMEHAAAAAPMAELLDRVTQVGLENPRLFALTERALSALCAATAEQAPLVASAHLLKALAFCGLRPSLDVCVGCGEAHGEAPDGRAYLSFREGGAVCASCRTHVEAVAVPAYALDWARYVLGATFDDLLAQDANVSAAFAVLSICQQWVREHVGVNLKSLNFLFTSGLYQQP